MITIEKPRDTETTIVTTDEGFSRHYWPYSWKFYVDGANKCAGTCFCLTPLKECSVLQYALKEENLDTNVYHTYRESNPVAYNDASHDYDDFSFTFTPKGNPETLRRKLTDICNKCPACRIPWNNAKQK